MSKKEEPGPYIRHFVHEATPIFKERFSDSRCLNATRICLDVMNAFNVRAVPMSVRTLAMNKIYCERFRRLDRLPTEPEMVQWVDEGGWAIGIDTDPTATNHATNAWGGHLVAIVQDWIVDGSALQMSRPARDIVLPDIFVGRTTSRFLKGKEGLHFQSPNGAQLSYFARLDDREWKEMGGFQPSPWNTEIAIEIANRMAARLGRKPFRL